MTPPQPSYKNKKLFGIGLIVLQICVVIIYAFVIRVEVHNDNDSIGYNYPSYLDLIVMLTLGMGFLNTFIRSYMYTGMIHNWLFYCVSIQIFFIFSAMWKRAFGKQSFGRNHAGEGIWMIQLREQDYTLAAYSTSVMNMTFGICFGRIGYLQKLIIVVCQMIAYTFNAIILNDVLQVYDVGGSIFCHIFGCYFGMGVSLIISRFKRPITKIQHSYQSIIFSYVGCFFIFAFAPSINSQYLTETPFQKSVVIMNTILSMCCSVMSSFAMSVFIKKKFSVIDLFNGSLCGCIGAGSSAGLFVNPCACMILGAVSGITCVVGMQYLTGYLQRKLTLFDTFGIHNVRGLPGIIGGIGGAIAIALSYTVPQDSLKQLHYLSSHQGRSIGQMVGYQILGTFSSVLLSFICGLFTGYIITLVYNIDPIDFYKDSIYFQLPQSALRQFKKKGAHIKKKQSFMDKDFVEFGSSFDNTISQDSFEKLAYNNQNSDSDIFQAGSMQRLKKPNPKLSPLKKKITFKQKIQQTLQKLNHAPVEQVQNEQEQSQIQQQQSRSNKIEGKQFQQRVDKQQQEEQDDFDREMRLKRENLERQQQLKIGYNLGKQQIIMNSQLRQQNATSKQRIIQIKPKQLNKDQQEYNIST